MSPACHLSWASRISAHKCRINGAAMRHDACFDTETSLNSLACDLRYHPRPGYVLKDSTRRIRDRRDVTRRDDQSCDSVENCLSDSAHVDAHHRYTCRHRLNGGCRNTLRPRNRGNKLNVTRPKPGCHVSLLTEEQNAFGRYPTHHHLGFYIMGIFGVMWINSANHYEPRVWMAFINPDGSPTKILNALLRVYVGKSTNDRRALGYVKRVADRATALGRAIEYVCIYCRTKDLYGLGDQTMLIMGRDESLAPEHK